MSKIIALDFGLKRTGIAISDNAATFAFGLETVPSDTLISYLKDLIVKENVAVIVLGLPVKPDGSDTDITANVRMLGDVITEKFKEVKLEYYDERFTSVIASRSMHMSGATKKQKSEKGLVDKVSATILLQSYLSAKQ